MFPTSSKVDIYAVARTEGDLLQALRANINGAAVVTSTARAARALRLHYDEWQHVSGSSGWMTPRILAWDPWLEMLWDRAVLSGIENRVLLTSVQELELWNRILAHDTAATQTLSVDAMAELAQRAWKQMHQYRIAPSRFRDDSSLDTQAFYRWTTEFEKTCRKLSFVSPSLLEAALAQCIQSHEISLPEELFMVGFDRATPAQLLLIDALAARGCSAQFIELRRTEAGESSPTIICVRTAEEEIASAARWIRRELVRNPAQRIGVVVPSLEESRAEIDRTFRRVLAPSSMDIRAEGSRLPYEFSLGTPMYRLQPIRTAMALLAWLAEALPPEDVSWVVVHGGFGDRSNASQNARARLDREFRERAFQLGGSVSVANFLQWLSHSASGEEAARLRRILERMVTVVKRYGMSKSRPFTEWREAIEELLEAAQWHLLTADTSAGYQLLQRWTVLLNELSALATVTAPARFPTALQKLDQLASHMLFALETRNAPVQVLGIAESAGLVFDCIWWLNAQSSVWPPRGTAQPFLPWNLQREAHMPYADPGGDSAFALRTTKRILASATTAIVSFALQAHDEKNSSSHISDRETVLSPLVREALPQTPIRSVDDVLEPTQSKQPGSTDTHTENQLETIEEEFAVPFQGGNVRGGVRFLELHAACPFRAFAEVRLGTRQLTELSTGLSPAAQGTIMHRVLDQFWQQTKSRKNLLAGGTEQHRQSIREHTFAALEKFFKNTNEPWQKELLNIEADRIEDRLLEWLEVEKQRGEFTVLKTEHTLEGIHLEKIELQCRIDRIDEVDQGIVLMDYKTGTIDRNACEGDRPDQPQLLAYAVLRQQSESVETPLAGLAFAGLHPRKVEFLPVSSLPGIFPAVPGKREDKRTSASPEEMQERRESWELTLTRMAREFQAGAAMVDPKRGTKTCAVCGQALLCRIQEASAVAGLDEESASDAESPDSPPSKEGLER